MKCTVRDGKFVEPCDALSKACEGTVQGAKKKGIFVWPMSNITTGKETRTIFGAVTSEHPKGLIFNFCPWCGSDLTEANQA